MVINSRIISAETFTKTSHKTNRLTLLTIVNRCIYRNHRMEAWFLTLSCWYAIIEYLIRMWHNIRSFVPCFEIIPFVHGFQSHTSPIIVHVHFVLSFIVAEVGLVWQICTIEMINTIHRCLNDQWSMNTLHYIFKR